MVDEAQRQAALLASLNASAPQPEALRLREDGDRAVSGLAAYRGNAAATADRALATIFPTVRKMVGEKDFRRLAEEFRQLAPPLQGDLGDWGADFPGVVERHGGLIPWPWLADCARLDLAVHRNERAADAVCDVASLALLQGADPALLRLQLMPGTALLCSRWPIATIHAAHRLRPTDADDAFEPVRRALDEGRGENVLVVRQGWRAVQHLLDPVEADWTQSLLDGDALTTALRGAGDRFDFAAWLALAVGEGRLECVVPMPSRRWTPEAETGFRMSRDDAEPGRADRRPSVPTATAREPQTRVVAPRV